METVELSSHYCSFCMEETTHTLQRIGKALAYVCACGNASDKDLTDIAESQLLRGEIQFAADTKVEKPCLWCRIFGHMWFKIVTKTTRLGKASAQKIDMITFDNCARCGKMNPNYGVYCEKTEKGGE